MIIRNTYYAKIISLVHGSILLVIGLCSYFYMIHSPNFEASTIKIKGNIVLSSEDVLKRAGIQPHTNIFEVKPVEIKSRLESDAWIKQASVRRELPNRVIIELQERKPFMVWILGTKSEKKRYLIDQEGMVLREIQEGDESTVGLPVLISNARENSSILNNGAFIEGNKETTYLQKVVPEIAKILQANIPLFKEVKEIALSGIDIITLIPSTQTPEVRIHLQDYQENLEYLKMLLPRLDSANLNYIDLRFKKRVIIKPNNS